MAVAEVTGQDLTWRIHFLIAKQFEGGGKIAALIVRESLFVAAHAFRARAIPASFAQSS